MIKYFVGFAFLFAGPIAWSAISYYSNGVLHWRDARWDSAGLLSTDIDRSEPVFQVFTARAWGKKGIVAVHSWIAIKQAGDDRFHRFDVVGWGVAHGRDAIRRNMRPVDGFWAGNPPELIADIRGPEAQRAIDHATRAIDQYPHSQEYRTWPGPNSNSFVAHILRSIPNSGIELPVTAIGKDFLADQQFFSKAPSGTGFQISIFGLIGFTAAKVEGLEVNLFGFVIGIDLARIGIKLPGIGRISLL